jgi:hypothetical protein
MVEMSMESKVITQRIDDLTRDAWLALSQYIGGKTRDYEFYPLVKDIRVKILELRKIQSMMIDEEIRSKAAVKKK